jgi:hypothetical protein
MISREGSGVLKLMERRKEMQLLVVEGLLKNSRMSAIEPSNWAGLPLSAVTGNIAINAPTNVLGQGEDDVEVLDSALRRGPRSGTLFPIGFAVATQHVGDFQLGTIHGPVLRSTAPTESSCLIGPAMPGQPVSQLLSLCPTPQRDASPLDRRSHPANGSVDPMESIQTP